MRWEALWVLLAPILIGALAAVSIRRRRLKGRYRDAAAVGFVAIFMILGLAMYVFAIFYFLGGGSDGCR